MFAVWGGISGAQTTVPLTLTHGARRGIAVAHLVELLSTRAAERLRLPDKGRLEPGADADLAIVRLGDEWRLEADDHRPGAHRARRVDDPARRHGLRRGQRGGRAVRAPRGAGAGGRPMTGPHARTAVRRDHAVIAPETHAPGPVPGWSGATHVRLIAPPMGARFAVSLVRMEADAAAGAHLPDGDDPRALGGWHQPPPGRVHLARGDRSWHRGARRGAQEARRLRL